MKELSWFERFYTAFFYRDLCYIFSGGLLFSVMKYLIWNELTLPQGLSLEVVGFLLISYYLGIAIGSLNDLLKLSPSKALLPKGYMSRLVLKQDIIEKYDVHVVNEYLRLMDQQLIGRTVGTSSLLSAVLLIINAL